MSSKYIRCHAVPSPVLGDGASWYRPHNYHHPIGYAGYRADSAVHVRHLHEWRGQRRLDSISVMQLECEEMCEPLNDVKSLTFQSEAMRI